MVERVEYEYPAARDRLAVARALSVGVVDA
jgi:hypothetical protein